MGTEAEGTSAPPAEGSAAPEVAAFCEAELGAEAAMASEDPATLGPAFEALAAAAPEDISETVEEVITHVREVALQREVPVPDRKRVAHEAVYLEVGCQRHFAIAERNARAAGAALRCDSLDCRVE